MAITRSRKIPKCSTVENDNIKSKSEKKNENINSKINKTKTSSRDSYKTSKITKYKNSKKQNIKSSKHQNSNANNNNNNNGGETNKISIDSINSEIFKAASIDSKGKKLPPYKVEQLQRLQELIKMSSIAKPRGPITYNDNLNRSCNKKQFSTSLKLIDKSNKEKVSNVTNYNPIRQSYLNYELTESEKKEFKDKFEKIRNYQNIKVPKLSDDNFLKNILSEIVNQDYGLKFYNYFTNKLEIESFGNQTLLNNERKLQLHENNIIQRENLLNQNQKKHIENFPVDINSREFNENNLKYEKINIEQVITNSNLDTMLNNIPNSFSEIENEQDIFKGLNKQDFTTIREFNFKKI